MGDIPIKSIAAGNIQKIDQHHQAKAHRPKIAAHFFELSAAINNGVIAIPASQGAGIPGKLKQISRTERVQSKTAGAWLNRSIIFSSLSPYLPRDLRYKASTSSFSLLRLVSTMPGQSG